MVDSGKVGGYPPLPADPPSGAYAAVPGASSAFPPLRPPPLAEDPGNDGGSYLAVQVNLLRTGAFDQTPVAGQEQIVGRHKHSGVSLDLVPETAHVPADEPLYATDPASLVVPANSHVRKANPRRTAERDGERRMLRRGYPLVRRDGNTLGRGLVFVAFARSLSTQFEFVTRAWLNNPNFPTPGAGADALSAFVGPAVCGGYYFAPPLQDPTRPETWQVPAAG